MIPDHTLDRIRDATDIVELISAYVKLRKRGQNYIGLCPFHSEKTPSFNVNPSRAIYHCFGCGKGGDVFKFLMDHDRMGFVDAVQMLGERSHIEIPRDGTDRRDERSKTQKACDVAVEYFDKALAHDTLGARARDYLLERHLSEELGRMFGIGYAPARSRGLIQYADRSNISLRDLESAGLVVSGRDRTADRFRDRLMFPIRNVSGKVIAFGGRDLSGTSPAKYLNSPETALYQKGRVLYGLYESRSAIQKVGTVIVCEGYFDLIRLHDFGFDHSVAISGTALTAEQGKILARYAERAILLLDADSAGHRAVLRSVPVLYDAGLDVSIAELSAGEDPDGFLLSTGAEPLRELLDRAPGYIEYLEGRAGGAFGHLSPQAQSRLIDDIAETVRHIQDAVRRDLIIHAAWSRLGIPEENLRMRLAAHSPGSARASSDFPDRPADWREELLALLVQEPELRSHAKTGIQSADFDVELHQRLVRLLFQDDYLMAPASALMQKGLPMEVQAELSRLASATILSENRGSALEAYLMKVRRTRLSGETQKLLGEIGAAERSGDEVAVARLSARHQALRAEWLKLEKSQRSSSRGGLESPGREL
jgi:DNA primase